MNNINKHSNRILSLQNTDVLTFNHSLFTKIKSNMKTLFFQLNRFSLVLLLIGCLASDTTFAQTPGSLDTGFVPPHIPAFNSGTGADVYIRTVVLQDDGKILIGGNFTKYNGTKINRIARLNPDGSLDHTFDPGTGPDYDVYAIAVQHDGKILVGGHFKSYNGTIRNYIVRINDDGSLDTSFNPGTGADYTVRSIVVQPDGKILIGGGFSKYNGTTRKGIARLNTNGSLDTSFNPGTGANGFITSISLQEDGKILIGGSFALYNGVARNNIARLNANGSTDLSFYPGLGTDGAINTIAIQPDGKILVGGQFKTYNDADRNNIVRIKTNGDLDGEFNPSKGTNRAISSINVQVGGRILISGDFTSFNGTSRNRIARLNANGSLNTSFSPTTGANEYVETVLAQSDGKILMVGGFTKYEGVSCNRIARINDNGSLDKGSAFNGIIRAMEVQPDGKVLVGGAFSGARNRVARLFDNGSLDNAFWASGAEINGDVHSISLLSDKRIVLAGNATNWGGSKRNGIARFYENGSFDGSLLNPASGPNDVIRSVTVLSSGKMLVGGSFTTYDGRNRSGIVRLLNNGMLDKDFNQSTGTNGEVYTVVVQPDGRILIAGDFTSYNGIQRNRIARLHEDGRLDTAFDPGMGANSYVETMAIQPDGKILIGGWFSRYDGTSRNRIARLNQDGSLDTTFDPGIAANNDIFSIALQEDGKVIIGGQFTQYNDVTRNRVARLYPDGSLDTEFDPGVGANAAVHSITILPDGNILIAGDFTQYDGTERGRIARIFGGNTTTTNTGDYLEMDGITLYPNPAKDVININGVVENAEIHIYDISGKVRYSTKSLGEQTTIPLNGYSNGMYLIRIQNQGESVTKKFVISN